MFYAIIYKFIRMALFNFKFNEGQIKKAIKIECFSYKSGHFRESF